MKMMEQFGEGGSLGFGMCGGGRGMIGREKGQRGQREDGVLLVAGPSADRVERKDGAMVFGVVFTGAWRAFP